MWRALWLGVVWVAAAQAGAREELTFAADDRVLIVAPHPDDETIATGGLIRSLTAASISVHVAFLTYGDGWDWATSLTSGGRVPADTDYVAIGRRRHQEATGAATALGLPLDRLYFFGFPDDGLAPLWDRAWTGKPIPSPHTGAQMVPYSDALAAGAPYTGEALVQSLVRVLRIVRPTTVIVPHPADIHPDHAIAPRFVAEALGSLRGQRVLPRKVRRLTYLVHYPEWPVLATGPAPMTAPTQRQVPATRWHLHTLTDAELAAKTRALEEHRTQVDASPEFLRNFLRTTELFGRVQSKVWGEFARTH
jgi:LmbE family N-acetylglucosaminyl deacetylase